MPQILGEDRNQIFMISLDTMIPEDDFVRVLDAFVDAIDMKSFGFTQTIDKKDGRPYYPAQVLMKLYLYGYHYGIRSSRKLECEAAYNLQAMWLTQCRYPRYKTIADFRKNNAKAFRAVFRSFVKLLAKWELADGELIAIDSFKIRAQNSLKNNLNQNKIDRHLEYIDNKVAEYEQALTQADQEEDKKALQAKIETQNLRKQGYEKLQEQLQQSGQEQISLTDADAKSVVLHRNIINVGYNIQASCDAKHKLLVEYETGQVNDTHALAEMAIATQEILQPQNMHVLADKGYHTGEELFVCKENGITTFVSPKEPSTPQNNLYPINNFEYNRELDVYICPAGEQLSSNQNWLKHSGKGKYSPFRFKRYTSKACKECRRRAECTNSKNGRAIDRSEYAQSIEENKQRILNDQDYYKLRQQITEHQFGTLKRQRGFTFTFVKGKEKVLGEVGLVFIGYNLSRCGSILKNKHVCNLLKKSNKNAHLN